jgi:hypothetical protein
MKTAALIPVMVLTLLAAVACSGNKNGKTINVPEGKEVLSGILKGDQVATGAETTGWALFTSTNSKLMDVDVAAVRADATALQGKRVDVLGTVVVKDYPERGPTPILVAEKITAAK